ncbi:MAG: DUF3987 domain-containing protein [Rhodoplanes sp.]
MQRYQPKTKPCPDNDAFDPYDTWTFLRTLDPDAGQFTYQTYDDNQDRTQKQKDLARIHHGALGAVLDKLDELNARGAGVLVALNETDGKGREQQNITRTRAVLLDLDGDNAPLDPVLYGPYLSRPHLVTETSPGHYHAIYRVEGLSPEEYPAAVYGLAKAFNGDPAAATIERCTRLPGFFSCKAIDDKFKVRIVHLSDHAPYSAAQFKRTFPPQQVTHRAPKSNVRTHTWDDPDTSLLDDRRGDLPDFPVEPLCGWLPDLVQDAAAGAAATPDHVAVPLLGIAAGLIGAARRIEAVRSWSEPATAWTGIVGFSGTGKTPGMSATRKPLDRAEEDYQTHGEDLRRDHELRVEQAKAARPCGRIAQSIG